MEFRDVPLDFEAGVFEARDLCEALPWKPSLTL